jgi:DNA mismatch repair protein MutS2
MEREGLLSRATRALEWPAIVEAVARYAISPIGAELCRKLAPSGSFEDAEEQLRQTGEMVVLEENGPGMPLSHFPDLRNLVGRVAKGALLTAVECRDVSILLAVGSDVRRFFRSHTEEAPILAAAAAPVDGLPTLKSSIDRAVDPEGNILESATSELRGLTQHAQVLKQKMRSRLEAMVASRRFADILQETYFAQRENRYVVPVKAERKSDVPGIVHDVSASGATVFIEPRELVDLNNQIKEADLAIEREVRRILHDLSNQAAAHHEVLLTNLDILGQLDCIRAKAILARQLQASNPVLNRDGRIRLKQARHPLLILSRQAEADHGAAHPIVPNDIELETGVKVLVISGPNAGGKTVALKIVGLFALMVRAGLHIPCFSGSEMSFFRHVYAEIGDAQDLMKDLSSFSAHISDMIALLREAAPDSLVLLDEPVTSTDPTEGAALAQALLVEMAAQGFTVIATTHYNPLKALAQSHPGFAGASVGFNPATLSPTYRLILGMPGGSSAIEIAGRLGMDERILDQAVGLVSSQERAIERLMEELQETRRLLDEDARRISELRAETEAAARQQKELTARQAATETETRKTVRKKLTDELLRARAQVQSVVEDLKSDKRLLKAREAKERLAAVEHEIQSRFVPADAPPVYELKSGDRVEVINLGTVATLLENPSGKQRVRVRIGETEVSVDVSRLAGVGPTESEADRRAKGQPSAITKPPGAQTSPAVLDLRGKMADEALENLQRCLDQALLQGSGEVRIIHGHGTGRLRQVVREHLKESPYVARFRSGERAEGGDGVTIVMLK